jgi:DNA-binding IclR family transcriptional regulator
VEPVSQNETPSTSRSVERVCAVLSAFTVAAPQLTLGELAQRTELPKPTVHRLAASLVTTGFLRRERGNRYALGEKLSQLGAAARAEFDLTEVCRAALDLLAARTGETVMLAVPDWSALELTVIGSRVSDRMLSVLPLVGRHVAISAGAIGKALLLGLPAEELESALRRATLPAWTTQSRVDPERLLDDLAESRDSGVVVAHGEFAEGVSGVATPVLFEDGWARAAIGITGPSARIDGRLDELGQLLREATVDLQGAPGAVQAA